jgi:acyl carrier protein
MNRDTLQATLIQVVTENQQNSGRQVSVVDGQTCPTQDLDGFDSLNAVEVSSDLSRLLGCKIPRDVMLSKDPNNPFTIDQITDRLCGLMGTT